MTGLKVGRNVFDINASDVVRFNGVSWFLISRQIYGEYGVLHSPSMSKCLCKKLVKKNILVLIKKEKEYVTRDGKQMGLYYYKFDIKKLEEYLQKSNKKE